MDYYQILGVPPNASQEEIERAYRQNAKLLHPDQYPPDQRPEFEKKMKALNQAYSVLRDPEKRQAYRYGESLGSSFRPPSRGKVVIATISGRGCFISLAILALCLFLFKVWGVLVWVMLSYLLLVRKSKA